MKISYFQKGFNFSQDGPGNRLVYHLQGCNFRCPWCANPEGIALKSSGAFEAEVDTLVAECVDCSMMFFDGGGVTLTGGEPTLQFEAVKELFSKLRACGISTALECNASSPRLPELFELTDFLITDCKHYSGRQHKSVCGVGIDTVINNISLAAKQRNQLLIRIPLINGFNASAQDAEGFAALFKKICSDNCSYELLPYHEFGKDKYARCGMEYTVKDGFVSDDAVEHFRRVFKENNLKLIHT